MNMSQKLGHYKNNKLKKYRSLHSARIDRSHEKLN